VNKWLLFKRVESGWSTGIIIGIVSAAYFSIVGLYILALAEIGYFLAMVFGRFSNKLSSSSPLFSAAITLITCAVGVAAFAGMLTTLQLVASVSFVWGGFGLATSRFRVGWALILAAHVATMLAAWHVNQILFSGLQAASAAVALYAFSASLGRAQAR
jgi:cell shape-determining protein MreD